jgi:hypothetical protein
MLWACLSSWVCWGSALKATSLGSRSETLNAGDYFVQVYAPVNTSGPFPIESTAYSLNIL